MTTVKDKLEFTTIFCANLSNLEENEASKPAIQAAVIVMLSNLGYSYEESYKQALKITDLIGHEFSMAFNKQNFGDKVSATIALIDVAVDKMEVTK